MTGPEILAQHHMAMGDPLATVFFHLEREVVSLSAKWDDYGRLFQHADRVELFRNTARYFFGRLEDVLWEDLLLHLSRLLDPPRSVGHDNLSLDRLPPLLADAALNTEVTGLIAQAKAEGEFARQYRHRRLAHMELPPLPGQPVRQPLQASLQQFETCWETVCDVLLLIHKRYYPDVGEDYRNVLDALGGVNALDFYLTKGLEAVNREGIDASSY